MNFTHITILDHTLTFCCCISSCRTITHHHFSAVVCYICVEDVLTNIWIPGIVL